MRRKKYMKTLLLATILTPPTIVMGQRLSTNTEILTNWQDDCDSA